MRRPRASVTAYIVALAIAMAAGLGLTGSVSAKEDGGPAETEQGEAELARPVGEAEGIATFNADNGGLAIATPEELIALPGGVPDRDDFAFLGEPGDEVWVAGTTDGWVFPTLDASKADTDITVDLRKKEGPGRAWLYTFTGPGFAEPLASTANDDTFVIPAGTTLSAVVLAVDRSGSYQLQLRASADGSNGSDGAGDSRTPEAEDIADLTVLADDPPSGDGQVAFSGVGMLPAQAGGERVVFTEGHMDIGPRFVDGVWTVQVRDDTGSSQQWRDLADVVLAVPDGALFDVPENDDFDFLGDPGDQIYLLPQVQDDALIWPGWNTQDPSVIDNVPGTVDFELLSVDGPGQFTLFLTGTFGGVEVLFDSAAGLPQTLTIPRNTHAHGNWTFSEPGVYHLEVEFSATTGDGEDVTDTKTVRFAVGDGTDPEEAFGGSSSGGGGGGAGSGGGGGDGDEDGDGGGTDESSGLAGMLPSTGAGWLLLVGGAGLAAALIGGTILLLTRRRVRRTAS